MCVSCNIYQSIYGKKKHEFQFVKNNMAEENPCFDGRLFGSVQDGGSNIRTLSPELS